MADEKSLRDDILDAAGEKPEETVEEVIEDEVEATTETEATQEASEEVSAEPETELDTKAEGEELPEPVKTKPPVDWAPAVAEKWNDLPPEVRESIANRERDINTTLQQTTESRRIAEHFVKTVEPFRALMASEGTTDPFVAVQGLMNTAAQLKMGTPQQKAERIAGLINHYGIDINTLDDVLSGQAPQQAQVPQDPRIDEVYNRMQQADQQHAQRLEYEANQSIGEFRADPANVWVDKVRFVMADFMDMAARNNQPLSVKDAYDRACALDPEINAILQQQRAVEAGKSQQGMLQNKRRAASSIRGTRASGGAVDSFDGMSLRETIAAQVDEADRI